jgi:hypothetical protein
VCRRLNYLSDLSGDRCGPVADQNCIADCRVVVRPLQSHIAMARQRFILREPQKFQEKIPILPRNQRLGWML